MKKLLSVVLCCILLLGLLPAAVHAEDTVFEISTPEELKTAVSEINAVDDGAYVISLNADIDCSTVGTLHFGKNTTTILGNGYTLDFGATAYAITVGGGLANTPVLFLGCKDDAGNTLTLKSNGVNRGDGAKFIVVGGPGNYIDKGTLYMYDGVTVTGSVTNNTFGGAVTVGAGGSFVMEGGCITKSGVSGGSVCHGGGVAVISGGVFTMNGGVISECFADSSYDGGNGWQVPSATGGGVFVGNGSTFIMNGGIIEDNSAYWNGGGVMVMNSRKSASGGFGYLDSKFVMTGGSIRNNSANYVGGGLAVMGTYVNAYGLVAPTPESGKPGDPGVYLSGGTFSGNDASNGGGIFLNWIRPSIPVQIHSVTVTDNTADEGAGIDVLSSWTQADIDGCTITANRANGKGGGIALTGNITSAGTTLKNTTITENTSGDLGGGVYYDASSALSISGRNTIQDNRYNGTLNNLNIPDAEHPVFVTGSLSGSKIGLSDPALWADDLPDADVSAVAAPSLTDGFKAQNGEIAPDAVFTSDHSTWYPAWGEKYEGTFSSQWTNASWKNVTGMQYNQYVYATPGAGSMSGQSGQVYFDPDNNCLTTDQTGHNITIVQNGSDYYLAYKNGAGKYYILADIAMVEGTTRYFPIPDGYTLNGFAYLRCGSLSGLNGSNLYSQELGSNGDGYDHSSEVRLTRTTYTLHYNDGATADKTAFYIPSDPVSLEQPERAGYAFGGWYDNAALTGTAVQMTPAENLGNVDYYAKWIQMVTVTFDSNGHGTAPSPQTLAAGTTASKPADPSETGYIFAGWYTDAACKDADIFDFTTPIGEDITLYAKWLRQSTPIVPTAAVYKVSHYQEQPDGTYSLTAEDFPLYGEIGATATAVPKEYGHYHINEAMSVMSGEIFLPAQGADGVAYLTLSVYYDLDTLTVSYDLNGGKAADGVDYSAETAKYGASITLKAPPVRDGYDFTGWNDGTTVYPAGTAVRVTESMVLTAQWKEAAKPTEPSTPDPETPVTPSTGDSSHALLWVLLSVSFGYLTVMTVRAKKKRTA